SKMTARRLRADAGDLRELGRGECAPVHQGLQHGGPRGVARERGDFGESCVACHFRHPPRKSLRVSHWRCFGLHRSNCPRHSCTVALLQSRATATMRAFPGRNRFYGWTVVRAAFVLAALGWGLGFYAPPVFLGVIRESTGWPLGVISAAVTAHFLVGALVA